MIMGAYEEFFGFRTKPFELVPNPDFMYPSGTHKKAMTYLEYGIREKIGFILLTGEVGSGKTTLIRDLIKKLDARVKLSKVFNTNVNCEQLISMVNDDFGLDVRGKDKVMLLKDLNDYLIAQYAEGSHSVLIIDEAQNLGPELLEEVRMLSNLETDRTKLLQIILAGQPELGRTLARAELRQLRQRISISCNILPLTSEETIEYILHRLEVAGNRQAITFLDGTIDIVHNFSRGIPRFINIICDFLLLAAFAEETRQLSVDIVNDVIQSIDAENRYWHDEPHGQGGAENGGQLKGLMERLDNIEKEVVRTNELFIDFINRNPISFLRAGDSIACDGKRSIINALKRSKRVP